MTLYDSFEDEALAHKCSVMSPVELEKFKETTGIEIPRGEEVWFRAGQRVPESHRVFKGQSGENRKSRLFISEEEDPEYGGGLERLKRGPGRPRKVEVGA